MARGGKGVAREFHVPLTGSAEIDLNAKRFSGAIGEPSGSIFSAFGLHAKISAAVMRLRFLSSSEIGYTRRTKASHKNG